MSLEVRGITFHYTNDIKNVLENVSFSFPKNRITALTGKNGCGKTTLARIIMGILKPQTGNIFLDGEKIDGYSLAERGKRIGYVMQNPERQIFSSTVEKEVQFGLNNLELSEAEIKKRTNEYLQYFGIEHHRNDFPFALSHGEKQRLVLASVLAMKPEYLILDEPTAGLDFKRKKLLGEYLKNLNCGVIVISHDNDFNETYCDDIIKMEAYMDKWGGAG